MELFIVQERDLPITISGEIDNSNSEGVWENKRAFTTMAKAIKFIQTLDSTAKKTFPDIQNNYQYVGEHFEWNIDIIDFDEEQTTKIYRVVVQDNEGSRPDQNPPLEYNLWAENAQQAADKARERLGVTKDSNKYTIMAISQIVRCDDWE